MQLASGGALSLEHSGFANPLYDRDDVADTAAATEAGRMDDDDGDGRPAGDGGGFRPASALDEPAAKDTLKLVERDIDD